MIDTYAVSAAALNTPDGGPDAELAKMICVSRGQNPYDTAPLPNGCTAFRWQAVLTEAAILVHLGSIG